MSLHFTNKKKLGLILFLFLCAVIYSDISSPGGRSVKVILARVIGSLVEFAASHVCQLNQSVRPHPCVTGCVSGATAGKTLAVLHVPAALRLAERFSSGFRSERGLRAKRLAGV